MNSSSQLKLICLMQGLRDVAFRSFGSEKRCPTYKICPPFRQLYHTSSTAYSLDQSQLITRKSRQRKSIMIGQLFHRLSSKKKKNLHIETAHRRELHDLIYDRALIYTCHNSLPKYAMVLMKTYPRLFFPPNKTIQNSSILPTEMRRKQKHSGMDSEFKVFFSLLIMLSIWEGKFTGGLTFNFDDRPLCHHT